MRDRRADYRQSLRVLETAKQCAPPLITKTSIMLGLGETRSEVRFSGVFSVDRAMPARCPQRRDRRDHAGSVSASEQEPSAGEAVCDAGRVRGVESRGEGDGLPLCGQRTHDPEQLSRWRLGREGESSVEFFIRSLVEENEKKNRDGGDAGQTKENTHTCGSSSGNKSKVSLDAAFNSNLDAAFDAACDAGFKS